MITEDYVNPETAKLLKGKGYKGPFDGYYNDAGCVVDRPNVLLKEPKYQYYERVSLYMAMKWLREEHNLHCGVDYDFVLGWYCQITSLKETVEYDYEEMKHYHPDNDHGFSSPEEACEAAIKYCLENLI